MNPEKAQKKVALISSLYPPHLGGVEIYSHSLAHALAEYYDVHVFCMNTEALPETSAENGVTVHALPCVRLFNGRLPFPTAAAHRKAKVLFGEHEFSFGIVQTRLYPFNLWAAQWLRKMHTELMVIEHGTDYVSFGNQQTDFLWRKYEDYQTRQFKKTWASFYAVSQAGCYWLSRIGIESKGVIPNGILPEKFENGKTGWRKTRNIPADAILVTFAGRVIREKGILDLLNAFTQIQNDHLHLIIAGSGELQILQPWAENPRVHILGQIPHSELLEILRDSQIFCLPTTYPEGLPTVILEAGITGLPVIATAKGGIPEVIIHGTSGLIVPENDPASLAAAIKELAEDENRRGELGQALSKLICEKYTWDQIARQVQEIIEKAS